MSTGRPTIGLDQIRAPEVCGFDGNPRAPGRYVCADCAARLAKTARRLKRKAKRSSP